MGRKNKKSASGRKKPSAQTPLLPPAEDVAKDSGEPQLSGINKKIEVATVPVESKDLCFSSFATVKSECDKALTKLALGKHTEALRLLEECCSRHEKSADAAYAYVVQAMIFETVAYLKDDPNAKQWYLKKAIDSAKKATDLSSNSITFAHFNANFYEVTNDRQEYEEVVQEYERALAIQNPIDPAKERRIKKKKKNSSTVERKGWVSSLWNSMSLDSKKDLLNIRVSDLKAHFGLQKGLACEVVVEALAFAEVNKTWKFWVCCRCAEKFADSLSHMKHVAQVHLGILTPEMKKLLPRSVSKEWIEMLQNCSWNPLDLSAAVNRIENQSKLQGSDFQLDYHSVPTVDDTERAEYLEEIHANFQRLIRHDCLAARHVTKVIEFTMDELQSLVSGSQLVNHGVYKNPTCICFLGAAELKEILEFLQGISYSFGLNEYSEKIAPLDDMNSAAQNLEIKDKIVLNGDALCLIPDEYLLSDGAIEDATLANVNGSNGDGVVQDANGLLSWIFAGTSSGYQLASWMHMKEEKRQLGLEIHLMLEKEFDNVQAMCKRNLNCKRFQEAVQTVEDLCLEEDRKRGTATELVYRSYESVLRERRDEVVECENGVKLVRNRYELDVISIVLKEAEALSSNQVVYDDAFGFLTSQSCNLESGEDDICRAKRYLHKMDNFIEVAIHRLKERLSLTACKTDAHIIHEIRWKKQLELKFVLVCAQDYQSIMLPLVKSYLRVQLEDLAEKYATKKSDAAREALLAELAADSKKGVREGSDNSRHSQEKSKDKEKNKKFRKSKDSKASGANKPQMLDDEASEKISSAVVPDADPLDSETPSVNIDDLNQEEEFRRKIVIEETLEYQRQIENEAKEKHVAEQHKVTKQVFAEKAPAESSCSNVEVAEQISSAIVPDGDPLDSETPSVNTDDLNQEEESRRKIVIEESLQYQRQIENESKENHVAEQHKITKQVFAEKAPVESSCSNVEEQTRCVDGMSMKSGYAGLPNQVNRSKVPALVDLAMCQEYFQKVQQLIKAKKKQMADKEKSKNLSGEHI